MNGGARVKGGWIALAAAAIFGTTLWVVSRPSNPAPADAGRVPRPDPGPRVTMSFRDEDLRKAILEIAREAQASVAVAPDVKGKVTLQLNDEPWAKALSAVAKSCGFAAVPARSGIVRVIHPEEVRKEDLCREALGDWLLPPAGKEDEKVTLDLKDTEVRNVIDLIARMAGGNAAISPDVKGPVTVIFREVPWTDALDAVVRSLGYAAVRDPSSEIVRVEHPDDLIQERKRLDRLPRLERAAPGAPRLTFVFRDADVRVVLKTISQTSGAKLDVAPEVKGAVSLYVNALPWDDVLDNAVRALGFVAVKGEAGAVRVILPEK